MFSIKEFLHAEVNPALGCTEPGAVALAVARAVEELDHGEIQTIRVLVSDSIYKNGMYVGIPGTNGLKGNEVAAALGAICGKSAYGLEVLKDCDEESVKQSDQYIRDKMIEIVPDMERHGVYVEATVTTTSGNATCIIEKSHANITGVTKNGENRFTAEISSNGNAKTVLEQVRKMDYRDLVALVEEMDADDVDHMMNGVEMNLKIAEHGFINDSGLNLGSTLKELAGDHYDSDDLSARIKAVSAAASDARMAGAPLPVMSSAGSGNHGITAVIPVAITGKYLNKSREEIAKALALSHLTTSFVKSRMGRLSPVCGCAVAAGAGSSAGMVRLMGGDVEASIKAMEIVLGNLVGMLCDGAKESCSLKVSTGAVEAYYAAVLSMKGNGLDGSQGVIDSTIEKTVENAARVNVEGMKDVDAIIIDQIRSRCR